MSKTEHLTPNKIKEFRQKNGLSRQQLADLCHVGYHAVAKWESGENSPHGAAQEVLENLLSGKVGVLKLTPEESKIMERIVEMGRFDSISDFIEKALINFASGKGFSELKKIPDSESTELALRGAIPCGDPGGDIIEDGVKSVSVPKPSVPFPKKSFAVYADGHSMSPTIPNGSIVVLAPTETAEHNDVVAVHFENENSMTLKRFKEDRSGQRFFTADNPAFAQPVFTENSPAHIQAKYITHFAGNQVL